MFLSNLSVTLTVLYIVWNNYIILFPNTHLLSVFWHYIKSFSWDTEHWQARIQQNRTAENVKSSCFIHLAHVFSPELCLWKCRKNDTHFVCRSFFFFFLTRIWVYVFLSGLCGLITASSSEFWRQTSAALFFLSDCSLPLASLPPCNFLKILESATSLSL